MHQDAGAGEIARVVTFACPPPSPIWRGATPARGKAAAPPLADRFAGASGLDILAAESEADFALSTAAGLRILAATPWMEPGPPRQRANWAAGCRLLRIAARGPCPACGIRSVR